MAALLLVLFGVLATTWLDRLNTTSWDRTLWVGIFPINGDGSAVADDYISKLSVEDFATIETFFAEQTSRYGVKVSQPVQIELYPASSQKPPALPPRPNALQTALWSLKLRWFARGAADVPDRAPSHIRIFVLYHDPAVNPSVPHSLGMQKGLVGVVHAFADRNMAGSNNIVIAHETLHTRRRDGQIRPGERRAAVPERFRRPGSVAALSAGVRGDHGGPARGVRDRTGNAFQPEERTRRACHRGGDRVDTPVTQAAADFQCARVATRDAGCGIACYHRRIARARYGAIG